MSSKLCTNFTSSKEQPNSTWLSNCWAITMPHLQSSAKNAVFGGLQKKKKIIFSSHWSTDSRMYSAGDETVGVWWHILTGIPLCARNVMPPKGEIKKKKKSVICNSISKSYRAWCEIQDRILERNLLGKCVRTSGNLWICFSTLEGCAVFQHFHVVYSLHLILELVSGLLQRCIWLAVR